MSVCLCAYMFNISETGGGACHFHMAVLVLIVDGGHQRSHSDPQFYDTAFAHLPLYLEATPHATHHRMGRGQVLVWQKESQQSVWFLGNHCHVTQQTPAVATMKCLVQEHDEDRGCLQKSWGWEEVVKW